MVFLAYMVLGAVAGVLAGLFGIGGGLIIVPALIFAFELQGVAPEIQPHLAVGTSLATIVFTAISSIRSHHAHGSVRWDLVRFLAIGLVLGAALGAQTAAQMSGALLKLVIGLFACAMAVKMWLDIRPKPGRSVPGPLGLVAAGGGIGWASAIFGIGGGSMMVPYLSWCNVRMQEAVGTSAACGLPIAVGGALANMVTGQGDPLLPEYSVGYVYLPALAGVVLTSMWTARWGVALAHRWSQQKLKRAFAVLLVIVGIRFVWKSLGV